MLIYFYDIRIKGKKAYNTLKRRFYYTLKNSALANAPRRTKSVFLVPDELEGSADRFFNRFRGFIEVYKVKTNKIEEVK